MKKTTLPIKKMKVKKSVLFLLVLLMTFSSTNRVNSESQEPQRSLDVPSKVSPFIASIKGKGFSNKRSVKTESTPSSTQNAVESSSIHQNQIIRSRWITAQNTNCQILVDLSLSNPSCTWTGGCKNVKADGRGILVLYSSGREFSRYEGEMKEGLPHGFGLYTENNGNKYEGSFKDGAFDGKGIYTIKQSIPSLQPSMLSSSGGSVTGEFSNNQPTIGVYNENVAQGPYSGEFKNWQLNGKGVIDVKVTKYQGEFLYNKFHGLGVAINFVNGVENRYEGKFVNGKPQSISLGFQKMLNTPTVNVKNANARQVAEEAQSIANLAKQKADEALTYIRLEKNRIKREIEEKKRQEELKKEREAKLKELARLEAQKSKLINREDNTQKPYVSASMDYETESNSDFDFKRLFS